MSGEIFFWLSLPLLEAACLRYYTPLSRRNEDCRGFPKTRACLKSLFSPAAFTTLPAMKYQWLMSDCGVGNSIDSSLAIASQMPTYSILLEIEVNSKQPEHSYSCQTRGLSISSNLTFCQ